MPPPLAGTPAMRSELSTMGVWDRDYTKRQADWGIGWGIHLPPRATLGLIILHVAAFVFVRVLLHDRGDLSLDWLALRGTDLHPAAIVLHPLANASLWTLIFTEPGSQHRVGFSRSEHMAPV